MVSSQDETFQYALAALQTGKANDAERLFKRLLSAEPKHVAGLNLLGVLLTKLGRFEEAENYLRRALNENATFDTTFYNYGLTLKALKKPTDALEQFNQALAINASVAETWNNRGTVFNDLKRYSEAVHDFNKAISINPKYAEAYYNKGKSLAELKVYDHAIGAYDTALALRADLAEAWLGRGDIFSKLERYDDALAACDKALTLKPDLAEAWLGRGDIFGKLRRYDDALTAYDKALTLKPDLAEAWLGRGDISGNLERYNDALTAYDKALTLKPDLAEAWLGRGDIFRKLKRYDDAFTAYDKALTFKADLKFGEGARLHAKMMMCDWMNFDVEILHLISAIRSQASASEPFTLLTIPSSSEDQLKCAKCWVAEQPPFAKLWCGEIYSHDRIRIAYLSSDLHEHATAYLMAGLFEQHDRSRFEVTAISYGPDQQSDMRRRLKRSFERFIDARLQSDQDIAELIRNREIDIAVDLKGFTKDARTNVFARRPAPIQVNYLGYPSTMGAQYIDYILADPMVIPEHHYNYYTEEVVLLPDCYQVNDAKRPISETAPTRSECGLPEKAFVFCCFNNTYKITPIIFDIWMRLLKATDNSVLWLIGGNSFAIANLAREVNKRGVSSDRLIFAPRMPVADHLARQRQADLFLDTLPYNAHTTASDALWAGLPVLTCLGSTFAGRVAGSLLKAVGLDELITTSLEDYEALALKLAQDRSLLLSLKDKLARNRETFPLFNTTRFTRHIEAAYMRMWERQQKGAKPQGFTVDPIN